MNDSPSTPPISAQSQASAAAGTPSAPAPPAGWRQPVPSMYLTRDIPGIGGEVKQRPEDFRVEELPLYPASGSGEHLYLTIEKRGRPTLEVIRDVARCFGVRQDAVGYAGMKDKLAVTVQRLSIHTPDNRTAENLSVSGVRVLRIERHTNKLRVGHLRGNRFVIRIRGLSDPSAVLSRALGCLDLLSRLGAPNFFGEQRFGFHLTNHEVGRRYLLRDWSGVCSTILGLVPDPTDDDAPARQAFTAGDLKRAAALWSDKHLIERTLARLLANGARPDHAVMQIQHAQRTFFVTAFQSAVFNRALARRLGERALDRLEVGDVAFLHRNGALFDVTDVELAQANLRERLQTIEISPSGPLWGPEMKQASGAAGTLESALLQETGVTIDHLSAQPRHAPGARRPFRIPVLNTSARAGVDDHGPFLGLAFELPPGSYATVILAEVMKPGLRSHPWGAE